MSEATVQQDHGRAGSVCRVPDTSAVVIHMALIVRGRQRRGTMRFEILEVVVLWFHDDLTQGHIFALENLGPLPPVQANRSQKRARRQTL